MNRKPKERKRLICVPPKSKKRVIPAKDRVHSYEKHFIHFEGSKGKYVPYLSLCETSPWIS